MTARFLRLWSSLNSTFQGRRVSGRLLSTRVARAPTRFWLRRVALGDQLGKRDDVTVVIGVRNRSDHRLVNALRSISEQTHPSELLFTTVVDYGSDPAHAERTAEVCRAHGARYLRVDTLRPWSRSRCLNIGIRSATTKYLLTSDVDVVYSPGYIASAVATLDSAPLSVVCSQMLDLPEAANASFIAAAEDEGDIELDDWRDMSSPRFDIEIHPSVAVTFTEFFRLIRGYDEFFEVWGGEDRDMMRRLTYLGADFVAMESQNFYLHQWHPKFEGVDQGQDSPRIRQNRQHFKKNHTILRNDEGWGTERETNSPDVIG